MKRRRASYNPIKRDAEERVRLAVLAAGIRPGALPIPAGLRLSATWFEPSAKRDPDNVVAGGRKVILDALVSLGVIHCDGRHCVRAFEDEVTEGAMAAEPGVRVTMYAHGVFAGRFCVSGTLPDLNALLAARELGARRSAARNAAAGARAEANALIERALAIRARKIGGVA